MIRSYLLLQPNISISKIRKIVDEKVTDECYVQILGLCGVSKERDGERKLSMLSCGNNAAMCFKVLGIDSEYIPKFKDSNVNVCIFGGVK